jgi:hypothetical protein
MATGSHIIIINHHYVLLIKEDVWHDETLQNNDKTCTVLQFPTCPRLATSSVPGLTPPNRALPQETRPPQIPRQKDTEAEKQWKTNASKSLKNTIIIHIINILVV